MSAPAERFPLLRPSPVFLTRAYDFIRMAAISQANIKLVGTHVGVGSARTAHRKWGWKTSP